MVDRVFPCQACGGPVRNPEGTRFLLSSTHPAVCPRCGAPHVYEAKIQLDESWVRRQMDELNDLRRQNDDDHDGRANSPDRSNARLRGTPGRATHPAREERRENANNDRGRGSEQEHHDLHHGPKDGLPPSGQSPEAFG